MKLFIDTIDIDDIKKYHDFGIIDGVTTNPSLISKSKDSFYRTVENICNVFRGDVSIEAISDTYEKIIQEGRKILDIAPNIVIKLPCSWDGLKACKYFSDNGHKVNMTLCFSTNQALLAAKLGATYVSPFIGRLDDIGQNGIKLISDIRKIYDNYSFDTKILAASVRTLEHVSLSSIYGADVVTLPTQLISQLPDHHLTDKGIERFNNDWKNSDLKI